MLCHFKTSKSFKNVTEKLTPISNLGMDSLYPWYRSWLNFGQFIRSASLNQTFPFSEERDHSILLFNRSLYFIGRRISMPSKRSRDLTIYTCQTFSDLKSSDADQERTYLRYSVDLIFRVLSCRSYWPLSPFLLEKYSVDRWLRLMIFEFWILILSSSYMHDMHVIMSFSESRSQ